MYPEAWKAHGSLLDATHSPGRLYLESSKTHNSVVNKDPCDALTYPPSHPEALGICPLLPQGIILLSVLQLDRLAIRQSNHSTSIRATLKMAWLDATRRSPCNQSMSRCWIPNAKDHLPRLPPWHPTCTCIDIGDAAARPGTRTSIQITELWPQGHCSRRIQGNTSTRPKTLAVTTSWRQIHIWDLKHHNFLVDDKSHIICLLDWESAGWYLEFWEYTTAMRFVPNGF